MTDTVKTGRVVGFTYTLKDDKGNIIEQSDASQPLEYLHGRNNIIPGLEKKIEGMKVGETMHVEVAPEEGYGKYDDKMLFKVPRQNFPKDVDLKPGLEFQADSENGVMVVRVKEVNEDSVLVDANHPMAGQTLHFDIKIDRIREATEQEDEHGHVHQHGHDH